MFIQRGEVNGGLDGTRGLDSHVPSPTGGKDKLWDDRR